MKIYDKISACFQCKHYSNSNPRISHVHRQSRDFFHSRYRRISLSVKKFARVQIICTIIYANTRVPSDIVFDSLFLCRRTSELIISSTDVSVLAINAMELFF